MDEDDELEHKVDPNDVYYISSLFAWLEMFDSTRVSLSHDKIMNTTVVYNLDKDEPDVRPT